MIKESKDWNLLVEATEEVRGMCSLETLLDFFSNPKNYMFVEGENVGLATHEYPGLFTVHWYFKDRGRKAIDLAKEMIANLFENYGAQAVRGVIKKDLKASRWACRQVGLKSQGFVTYADGDVNEIFVATKDTFLKGMHNG